MTTQAIDLDPEFFYGLTMWGEGWAAQIRDDSVAIHLGEGVPRSSEDNHPAVIPLDEARRLRDLLNLATARGYL